MHPEAYSFIAEQVAGLNVVPLRVLEIGSYNVNGSVRPLFAGCAAYVGIDTRPGPDVDEVTSAKDYHPDRLFDVVVSCETLEHDPDPVATLAAAHSALRQGGLLLLTMASPQRTPHGCDGGALPKGEHYAGIGSVQLSRWLNDWVDVQIMHVPSRGDLYATARKGRG